MTTWRLDSIAPALARSFRNAPLPKRRKAALLACEYAVLSSGVGGEDVDAALGLLRDQSFASGLLRERLATLVTGLDELYLGLLDEDGYAPAGSEAYAHFSRARAASALAFAIGGDDAELHEAIYESLAAVADREHLIDAVSGALW